MENLNYSVKHFNQKWTKKLYIKNPFPDNYVDQSFLELKKINGN